MFNQRLISTDLWVPCNNFSCSQQEPKALSLGTPVPDHWKSGASTAIALIITCDLSHGPQPGWLTESPKPFKMLIPGLHPVPSEFHPQGSVFEINDLSKWERLRWLGTLTLISLACKIQVSHESEQFTFSYLPSGLTVFPVFPPLSDAQKMFISPVACDWLPLVWERKWHVSLWEQGKAAVWPSMCSFPSAVTLTSHSGCAWVSHPSRDRLQTHSGIWAQNKPCLELITIPAKSSLSDLAWLRHCWALINYNSRTT